MNSRISSATSSSTNSLSSHSPILSHWESSSSLSGVAEGSHANANRPADAIPSTGENSNFPTVVFVCQPKSHSFQERWVPLPGGPSNPVKVGRLVARVKPATNNAIFDCKVLSRNHAILWFEDNKVWLKDTKSSNGTFVNGHRLSKGSEESSPREIYSGDIIQFGVEVLENQVTHGCIISQITVYNADGSELKKPGDEEMHESQAHYTSYYSPNQEQIYQLAQYLEEALFREKAMERKMQTLQSMLVEVECSAESTWQVLLNEDRLLAKLKSLENQLDIYSSNDSPESLKSKAAQAMQEKEIIEQKYEFLQEEFLQGKMKLLERLREVELLLTNSEEECSHLRRKCEEMDGNLIALNETFRKKAEELDALQKIFSESETAYSKEIAVLCRERDESKERVNEMQELITSLQEQVERLESDKCQAVEEYTGLRTSNIHDKENNAISTLPVRGAVSSSPFSLSHHMEEQAVLQELRNVYNHILLSKAGQPILSDCSSLAENHSASSGSESTFQLLQEMTHWLEESISLSSHYREAMASSSSNHEERAMDDAEDSNDIFFYITATHSQLDTCRLISLDSLQHLHRRLSHSLDAKQGVSHKEIQMMEVNEQCPPGTAENDQEHATDAEKYHHLQQELELVMQALEKSNSTAPEYNPIHELSSISFQTSISKLVDVLRLREAVNSSSKNALLLQLDHLKSEHDELCVTFAHKTDELKDELSECNKKLSESFQFIANLESINQALSVEKDNQVQINDILNNQVVKMQLEYESIKSEHEHCHLSQQPIVRNRLVEISHQPPMFAHSPDTPSNFHSPIVPTGTMSRQARMVSAVAVIPVMLFLAVIMVSLYLWITASPDTDISSSRKLPRPL